METTHFLLILCTFSLVINVIYLILFLRYQKYAEELNKDMAEALGKTVKLLSDGMGDVLKGLQSMQEWNEKAHTNLIDVNNDNSGKIYKAILREQAFLSKLGEQFGYRPRTDIEE